MCMGLKAVAPSLKYMKAPRKVYLLEFQVSAKTEEIGYIISLLSRKLIWNSKWRAMFL